MNQNKISNFSLFLLLYNFLVILFGAFVRATGSGAGCGAHWPLCNGEVIPRSIRVETAIEFTHRITSGLSLVFVIILFILVVKNAPKGPLRKAAFFSLFFTITEALVGAGLVLFELVAENTSMMRAVSVAIHLINTNLLLASISLVFLWSKFGVPSRRRFETIPIPGAAVVLTVFLLVLGASGAMTALGDTLFPSETLLEGFLMDLSPEAHFMIRLRIIHPIIAIVTGLGLGLFLIFTQKFIQTEQGLQIKTAFTVVYLLQLIFGGLNVVLLAPIWMQLIHLLIADLIWVLFIFYLNELLFMVDGDVFFRRSVPSSP